MGRTRSVPSADERAPTPSTPMGGKKKKQPALGADAVALETLTKGDGKTYPVDGDHLTVHYIGSLKSDNSVFDSSRDKKQPTQRNRKRS